MQVVVDGLLTEYKQTGTGKPVLLLHGWGDSSAGFSKLQAELSQSYQVTAVDLPGFGKTQNPPAVWGLDEYADFVQSFLAKINIEPYVILGHSNGGAIAIRGLGSKKLTASKLVLLASAGIRGEYKGRIKALRLLTKTGKVLTAPLPASAKKRLRKKVYTTVGSDMFVAEDLQETFKKVVTDDVRQDAARITIPSLLLYGDNDEQTPFRYGEILHGQLAQSTLIKIPDAEHFVHHDQLQPVLKTIEEFLA